MAPVGEKKNHIVKKKGTRARMDIILKLKDELKVEKWQVEAAIKLID